MCPSIDEVQIKQTRGHFEVSVHAEIFCSTDSSIKAANGLHEAYGMY